MQRCATVLQVINSRFEIDAEKFEEYAVETARKLVEEYPWYYLPPSVHKILIHGAEVIKHALVSIGELSEEAAEAKNKDIKQFRLQYTRKISRIATNTDLLNRLFLSSDPFISGARNLPTKKTSSLCQEVLNLLNI